MTTPHTDPTPEDTAFLDRQAAKLDPMNGTPRVDGMCSARNEPPSGLVWADDARKLERELAEECEKTRKFGTLEVQLESYKAQWKRHYEALAETQVKERAEHAFAAIHQIADTLGLDEYTESQVADSVKEILGKVRVDLAAATNREAALTAALNLASGQALALREIVARVASYSWIADGSPQLLHDAAAALTHPAPPVVPKAVVDGLADNLAILITELEHLAVHRTKFIYGHDDVRLREAREALAKYKEATP